MSYHERSDGEMDGMSDEELLAHIVASRENGNGVQARRAFSFFAFRRYRQLVARAMRKVKSREDAEDIAMTALRGALEADFDGSSVGEAMKFMLTILDRRVVDYWRAREGKETQPLPEDLDDEERRRPELGVDPDETGRVDLQDVVEQALGELGNDAHRMVVDLKVFQGFSAEETAAAVNAEFPDLDPPMSAANADQIVSRFRKILRRLLEEASGS